MENQQNDNILTPEDYKNIEKLNQTILESEFSECRHIYMDHTFLKDTRLGLMIASTFKEQREDMFNYLYDNLDKYNIRPIRNFLYTLPNFFITEEKLQEAYIKPENSSIIFDHSPDTDISCRLPELLLLIGTKNQLAGYSDRIDVDINIWPLHKNNLIEAWFVLLNQFNTKRFYFHLIEQDPKTIEANIWKGYKRLYIDNYATLITDDTPFLKALLKDSSLSKSSIYAPYSCIPKILKGWEEEYDFDYTNAESRDMRFKLTDYWFNMLTNFEFLQPKIYVKKEGVKNG